ncbi:transcriptional regulator domain-containing protein [Bosea minatitlanensis]
MHLPAAGFAWEYLRRNEDYRQDYNAAVLTDQPADRDLDVFANRWGLRFPLRPRRAA